MPHVMIYSPREVILRDGGVKTERSIDVCRCRSGVHVAACSFSGDNSLRSSVPGGRPEGSPARRLPLAVFPLLESQDTAMRLSSLAFVALAGSVGYVVARARPAAAVDEHSDHADHGAAVSAAPQSSGTSAQQAPNLPASATTAADRLAKSPRHGEWVAVKVGTDSVMSWVVYPER